VTGRSGSPALPARRIVATPLPWLGGLLALYLLVPLGAFFARVAASNDRGFSTPGLWGALYVSVATATISAASIAALGIPLAYVLARTRTRILKAVGVLVQLPLALPPLMGGIVLVAVVGPYTPVGEVFGRHLTDSMAGIVLAQSFVAAPFLIVAARSAFAAVDPSLREHAASLGHRELSRFWRVDLPIAAPGIRAGLLLSWLRAFGEYGATVVLSYHPYSLPVYTYVQFSSTGIPSTQAPTLLGLAVAVVVASLWRVRLPRRTRHPVLPTAGSPRPSVPKPVRCDLDVWLGDFHLVLAYSAVTPHLAVLGPSGSGKSATLRALTGLLGPGAGTVAYGAEPVHDVPVELRRIGYVPQGFGLLPHLRVWQQVCFGVGADPALARYWLDRLDLRGLQERFPSELSGGQRQRVALAQALARAPELLFLDEPFSALDAPVREELRAQMRALQRENELSTVLVTHDPEEAAYLAEELIVLSEGRVLQAGPREEVFSQPASPEVARLIGYRNLHRGTVVATGALVTGSARLGIGANGIAPGTPVVWSVRPEHVGVHPLLAPAHQPGSYEGIVVDCTDLGASTLIVVDVGGIELEARSATDHRFARAMPCRVDLPPEVIRVWPDPAGSSLPMPATTPLRSS